MRWGQIFFFLFAWLFSLRLLLSQTEPVVELLIINKLEDARFITVSPGGITYVFEKARNAILKYSPAGESLAIVSGFGLSKNNFTEPTDICSPNDLDLFLSDYSNHRIIQYDRSLNVNAIWQSDDQLVSMNNLFRYPKSIDVDHFGKLYLIDGENKRVVKITSSQKLERTFGGFDAGKGRLLNPKRIRVSNNGSVFVQDNDRILIYDQYGNYASTISNDSINHIQSFCVFNTDLIIMDSCKVVRITVDGMIESIKRLKTIDWLNDLNKPVDIAFQNKKLYFLSPNKLIGLPINIIFK
jgi:hypothetical protein